MFQMKQAPKVWFAVFRKDWAIHFHYKPEAG